MSSSQHIQSHGWQRKVLLRVNWLAPMQFLPRTAQQSHHSHRRHHPNKSSPDKQCFKQLHPSTPTKIHLWRSVQRIGRSGECQCAERACPICQRSHGAIRGVFCMLNPVRRPQPLSQELWGQRHIWLLGGPPSSLQMHQLRLQEWMD